MKGRVLHGLSTRSYPGACQPLEGSISVLHLISRMRTAVHSAVIFLFFCFTGDEGRGACLIKRVDQVIQASFG